MAKIKIKPFFTEYEVEVVTFWCGMIIGFFFGVAFGLHF